MEDSFPINPKVSILMNCYNGEKFLKKAIESIYAQTYQNWEILFVDNQSTDRSLEVAKSFDERLRIIPTPEFMNLGQAREFGLGHATGEYLAFLDVDDLWLPQKL